MIPVPKNQLQIKFEQFEQEKQQLERYGHVSSLTFEEWLTVKEYTKIEKKWQEKKK